VIVLLLVEVLQLQAQLIVNVIVQIAALA